MTFQKPLAFKVAVDDALRLYSNGGENEVLAPEWSEEKANFDRALADFQRQLSSNSEEGLTIESAPTALLKKLAKSYQQLDKYLASIQVYAEYDKDMLYQETGLSDESLEDYLGLYQNILAELKLRKDGEEEDEPLDILYELESVHVDEINYSYILSLIQTFIPPEDADSRELSPKDIQAVDDYIASLSKTNPGLAQIIADLWQEIQTDPDNYRSQSVSYILEQMIQSVIARHVQAFAKKWYVGADELRYLIDNYRKGAKKQAGESQLNHSQRYQDYKTEVSDALNPLRYKKEIKEAYTRLIEEVIEPLRVGR